MPSFRDPTDRPASGLSCTATLAFMGGAASHVQPETWTNTLLHPNAADLMRLMLSPSLF
jgi:hypothetical protein